jgi:anti-anti-sigma factor
MTEDRTIMSVRRPASVESEETLRLHVRKLDRAVEIDVLGAEALFDGEDIAALGAQLRRLLDDGADRLVLNFAGVRAMSSDVLGILATLSRRLDPGQGSIHVRGLDPLLREMLRICRLDRVLEVEGSGPALP